MKLIDFIGRSESPEPWAEGENIPWHDPDFSDRMLKAHLDPSNDAASRRPETIDEQVRWLHETILSGRPSRILDLGCGPGLYAARLARLGHTVTGLDISPASVRHARELAESEGLAYEFVHGDFRTADFGDDYGLIVQVYGELNVFRRTDARRLVQKSAAALSPGGRLLFEVDRPETTRAIGESGTEWRSQRSGLFSDHPHLYLKESFWQEDQRAATVRYWVIDATTAEVTRHAQSFAAYDGDEYKDMFGVAGMQDVELISDYPGVDGKRWMLTGVKG